MFVISFKLMNMSRYLNPYFKSNTSQHKNCCQKLCIISSQNNFSGLPSDQTESDFARTIYIFKENIRRDLTKTVVYFQPLLNWRSFKIFSKIWSIYRTIHLPILCHGIVSRLVILPFLRSYELRFVAFYSGVRSASLQRFDFTILLQVAINRKVY